MKMPTTSKSIKFITLQSLALISVLFLSACDGGIFGTGSADDPLIVQPEAGAPNTDVISGAQDLPPASSEDSTSGMSATEGDTETTGGVTGGETGTTSGEQIPTEAESPTNVGDTGGGMNPETPGATPPATPATERFTNETPTSNASTALVTLVNASTLTLNAFETSVDPDVLLFDAAGVAPASQSSSAALTNNLSSLIIVDNNNVGQALVTYDVFNTASGTVTTIFAYENNAELTSLALNTQTNTTDAMLAKVRIVQVSDLGDANVAGLIQLQSAGAAPGGQDNTFGPLSLETPSSAYAEVAAGDYQLVDLENRLPTTPLSFAGGNAYTVVLTGSAATDILVINDTASNN